MRGSTRHTIMQIKTAVKKLLPSKLKRYQKIALFAFVLLGSLFFISSVAQAGQGPVTDLINGLISAVSWMLIVTARICIGFTIFFLRFFITLASYNDYINADIVKLGWIMVRDVANMGFVVAMLVIAFATILGIEQYEFKKGLVKVILAAVFINFSNLIAQVFIDAAHVFTITFLNAISVTAGGNLITMFQLDKMLDFASNKPPGELKFEVLGGSIVAFVFSFMAMAAMGAYVLVMMLRVVLLWALIILSPLAYIFAVLPKTEKYSQEWWKEFGEQVMVAPIMVFFLWLSFAALGSGQALEQINSSPGAVPLKIKTTTDYSVSLTKISTWENMANFLLAITFMYIGIQKVGESGAYGGKILQNTMSTAKKIGVIASGYATGRWLVGGAADVGKKGVKEGLYRLPLVGGEKWERYAKTFGHGIKGMYMGKGFEITEKGEQIQGDLREEQTLAKALKAGGSEALAGDIERLEAQQSAANINLEGQRTNLEAQEAAGDMVNAEKTRAGIAETERELETIEGHLATNKRVKERIDREGYTADDVDEIEQNIQDLQKQLKGQVGGRGGGRVSGLIGAMARANIKSQKRLAKTERQADERKQLLWKRTGSQAGGYLVGMGRVGDVYRGREAQDRVERGWLAAESMRSKAKDEEYETMGKMEVLAKPRLKYNVNTGEITYEDTKGTVAERIAEHEVGRDQYQDAIKKLQGEARLKIVADFDANMSKSNNISAEIDKLKKELENVDSPEFANKIKKRIEQLEQELSGVERGSEEGQKLTDEIKVFKGVRDSLAFAQAQKNIQDLEAQTTADGFDPSSEKGQEMLRELERLREEFSAEGGEQKIQKWESWKTDLDDGILHEERRREQNREITEQKREELKTVTDEDERARIIKMIERGEEHDSKSASIITDLKSRRSLLDDPDNLDLVEKEIDAAQRRFTDWVPADAEEAEAYRAERTEKEAELARLREEYAPFAEDDVRAKELQEQISQKEAQLNGIDINSDEGRARLQAQQELPEDLRLLESMDGYMYGLQYYRDWSQARHDSQDEDLTQDERDQAAQRFADMDAVFTDHNSNERKAFNRVVGIQNGLSDEIRGYEDRKREIDTEMQGLQAIIDDPNESDENKATAAQSIGTLNAEKADIDTNHARAERRHGMIADVFSNDDLDTALNQTITEKIGQLDEAIAKQLVDFGPAGRAGTEREIEDLRAEHTERTAAKRTQVQAARQSAKAAISAQIDDQQAALKKVQQGVVKTMTGVTYGSFLQTKAEAQIVSEILDADEKRLVEGQLQKEYNLGALVDAAASQDNRGDWSKSVQAAREEGKVIAAEIDKKRKIEIGNFDRQLSGLQDKRGELQKQADTYGAASRIEKAMTGLDAKAQELRDQKDAVDASADSDQNKKKKKDALDKQLAALAQNRQKMADDLKKATKDRDKLAGVEKGMSDDEKKTKREEGEAAIKTQLNTTDSDIFTLSSTIKDKEKALEETDTYWAELMRRKKQNARKVKDEQTSLDKRANRLRSGDTGAANEIIESIETALSEEQAKPVAARDEAKIDKLKGDLTSMRKIKSKIGRAGLAWRYGVAKGKQADATRGYKYAHNLLLSEAEQRAIHDERGLDTPKSTLTELIEEYGKSFGEMSVDSFVANAGPMLTKMLKKNKAGTMTEQDRAALMGLFKRGFDRAWIDDAIYAIMDNEEAKELIGDELGWTNSKYSDEKVRDIQMLFATGANVDFVKDNAVVTSISDVLENDHGIRNTEEVMKMMSTGVYLDKSGVDVSQQVHDKVRESMASTNTKFSSEQEQNFVNFFKHLVKGDEQALLDVQSQRNKIVGGWMKEIRARQSEMQYLGNLRPEAIANGHYENAGWALTREVGGGESLYVAQGLRSARAHVMGDVRKSDVRTRAKSQTHSWADLDERNGQVVTQIREGQFTDTFNGIDPRTFNSINPRARVHMMGLSGSDKYSDFRDGSDGSFTAARMTDSTGALTNAGKTWSQELSQDSVYGSHFKKAKTRDRQQELMSAGIMNRLYAREIRGNTHGFLMLAAEAAGMDPTQAARDGKINFKMYNPAEGKEIRYRDVNRLIDDFNRGDWEMDANGRFSRSSKPSSQLQHFTPSSGKADEDYYLDE